MFNSNNKPSRWIFRALWLPLIATLAACGGGGDEGGDTQICLVLLIIPTTCTSSSAPPPPPPASTTGAGETGAANNGGNNTHRAVVVNFFQEFEPNNTMDNANAVNFPGAASDTSAAVEITGSVEQDEDGADFFIFTPLRSDTFLVYLCLDTCSEQVEGDEVYIAVYDQSQTTIASTPVGTASRQFLSAELVAGLAYYVEINGYNTGPAAFDYKLVVID